MDAGPGGEPPDTPWIDELDETDEVLFAVRGHWWALAVPVTVLFVTAAVSGFLLSTDPDPDSLATQVVAACVLVVLVRWTLLPWLRWLTTSHGLTARRLFVRRGIVAVEDRGLPLVRVTDVMRLPGGPVHRILGAGTLVVRADGADGEDGDLVLTGLPDADRLRHLILWHARDAGAPPGAAG